MTEPLTIGVAVLTLVLALVVGVLHWPRPPVLDGERWFKVLLSNLLLGRTEAAGGDEVAWAADVVRFVPYHPAGRLPERKVMEPATSVGSPALEGERALVEALERLNTPAARWAHLYDTDEIGLDARLGDPSRLGDAYLAATWLGPTWDWEALVKAGADGSALVQTLADGSHARWVLVPGTAADVPDLLGSLQRLLGERAVTLPLDGAGADLADKGLRKDLQARRDDPVHVDRALGLLHQLGILAPDLGDRLVLVFSGDAAPVVLDALRAHALLRDQTEAVVAIGANLGGLDGIPGPQGWDEATAWLQTHFTHQALDLEANRKCAWMALQWLDRDQAVPGAAGQPLERARFPRPVDEGGAYAYLDVVDLGPLPADPELPLSHVALALVTVVTCWVRARRS